MKAIITISDTHIGSTIGLCPLTGLVLPDGGRYMPNKFQTTLLKYWAHFWDKFVPKQIRGAKETIIVLNGDLIDGFHHNTINIATPSTDKQRDAAIEMFKPLEKFGEIFVTRGTEAHSGPGSEAEEGIAKGLNCAQNEIGEYSNWQHWIDIDDVIFQFAHHIGVTSSAAYESSAPMREMVAGLVEAAQWDRNLPDVFVRSHRHRFIPISIPSKRGRIHSVITPGWQLRTPFTERIDRMRMPHIGGVVFLVENNRCMIEEKIYPLPEPKMIKI
jgi:hypothetical protein